MLDNLAGLIKVKTIVTFCVLAAWMALALTGKLGAEAVNNVTMTVVAFYFGTQTEKRDALGA